MRSDWTADVELPPWPISNAFRVELDRTCSGDGEANCWCPRSPDVRDDEREQVIQQALQFVNGIHPEPYTARYLPMSPPFDGAQAIVLTEKNGLLFGYINVYSTLFDQEDEQCQ